MQNFKNLIEKRTSLAVIGLGYVGMYAFGYCICRPYKRNRF